MNLPCLQRRQPESKVLTFTTVRGGVRARCWWRGTRRELQITTEKTEAGVKRLAVVIYGALYTSRPCHNGRCSTTYGHARSFVRVATPTDAITVALLVQDEPASADARDSKTKVANHHVLSAKLRLVVVVAPYFVLCCSRSG